MRTRIVLAGLVAGVAALLPVAPASAVCVNAYQQLTGRCSPCNDIGAAYDNVNHRVGDALPDIPADCIA